MKPKAVALALGAALQLGGCQSPPLSPEQIARLDFGPRPSDYEPLVRAYLDTKLQQPRFALVEFKAGPEKLYQKETLVGERGYGWAVCLMISDKNTRGAYEDFYPMVVYIRDGKVVADNGGGLERAAGVGYARQRCRELGYPVPER